MEKDSVLMYTQYQGIYANAFINGYSEVMYKDGALRVEEKDINYSDLVSAFVSTGYYDGVNHGKYCIETFQQNNVSAEHLMAVVDKAYSRAFDTVMENVNNKEAEVAKKK